MKIFFTTCILFFGIIITCYGQDTLRMQDMPVVGNVYVLSSANSYSGFDSGETGENYSWDFSDLRRSGQRCDTILAPSQTDPTVSFFFIDNALNSNRSNQAYNGKQYNIGFTELTGITNYYYNSSSGYEQPGLAATINSVAIPIFYTPHDILYKFPLSFADEDSVSYEYDVDLSASIGFYYHVFIKRHNEVDGWGTLITPFGEFDVVRVHSTIVRQDSTFITSLNLGIKIPAVTSHEYKWLSKGFGLPLLEINTAATDSLITGIQYQDSVHLTGISEPEILISEPFVFPNPVSEELFVKYSLSQKSDIEFSIFSMDGKLIFKSFEPVNSPGLNIKNINLQKCFLPDGNYILKVKAGNSFTSTTFQKLNR